MIAAIRGQLVIHERGRDTGSEVAIGERERRAIDAFVDRINAISVV